MEQKGSDRVKTVEVESEREGQSYMSSSRDRIKLETEKKNRPRRDLFRGLDMEKGRVRTFLAKAQGSREHPEQGSRPVSSRSRSLHS